MTQARSLSVADRKLSMTAAQLRKWLVGSGVVTPTGFGFGGTLALSLLLTGGPVWSLAIVSWLIVYSSYLIDSLSEIDDFDDSLSSERTRHLFAQRNFLAIAGVGSFLSAMAITALVTNLAYAAFLLIFPIAVALYALPILSLISAGRLRWKCIKDIPYVKSFYTAFFWGLLGIFAVAYLGCAARVGVVLAAFMLFAFKVFIGTVYCDLKDIGRDRAAGVVNFAVSLGRERVLRLLTWLNWTTPFLLFVPVWAGVLPGAALFLSLTVVYAHMVFLAAGSPGADDEWLSNVVADAEWLLWPLYVVLGMSVL